MWFIYVFSILLYSSVLVCEINSRETDCSDDVIFRQILHRRWITEQLIGHYDSMVISLEYMDSFWFTAMIPEFTLNQFGHNISNKYYKPCSASHVRTTEKMLPEDIIIKSDIHRM